MSPEEMFRAAKSLDKKATHILREVAEIKGHKLDLEISRVSKEFLKHASERRNLP